MNEYFILEIDNLKYGKIVSDSRYESFVKALSDGECIKQYSIDNRAFRIHRVVVSPVTDWIEVK